MKTPDKRMVCAILLLFGYPMLLISAFINRKGLAVSFLFTLMFASLVLALNMGLAGCVVAYAVINILLAETVIMEKYDGIK